MFTESSDCNQILSSCAILDSPWMFLIAFELLSSVCQYWLVLVCLGARYSLGVLLSCMHRRYFIYLAYLLIGRSEKQHILKYVDPPNAVVIIALYTKLFLINIYFVVS